MAGGISLTNSTIAVVLNYWTLTKTFNYTYNQNKCQKWTLEDTLLCATQMDQHEHFLVNHCHIQTIHTL